MRTPAAPDRRRSDSTGRPSACARMRYSRLTPVPKSSVREHRPPIDRAATSITQARPSRTRSSAWTGPSESSSARVAACVASLTAVKSAPVSPEGVMYNVSSKYGPSSGSGLSNTASTVSSPPVSMPSTATSGPETNSSSSSGRPASTPAAAAMARTRSTAATASAGESARITPWLPDKLVGLTTQGSPTSCVSLPISSASAVGGTTANTG